MRALAAVGLMLAFRRQHYQEIATDLTDRDATERRITELYTKAVEQLGNDKAAGPSLTRVAQDGPGWPRMVQACPECPKLDESQVP